MLNCGLIKKKNVCCCKRIHENWPIFASCCLNGKWIFCAARWHTRFVHSEHLHAILIYCGRLKQLVFFFVRIQTPSKVFLQQGPLYNMSHSLYMFESMPLCRMFGLYCYLIWCLIYILRTYFPKKYALSKYINNLHIQGISFKFINKIFWIYTDCKLNIA